MQRYEPIKPIDKEAADRSMADADRLRQRWDDLAASLGEDRIRAAVNGERWRAAVETGVIERLYEVSRGVTEAIVRRGLEADEALDLDADVYDQIAAHEHAERVVVDAARRRHELTTSLIRELHAAVTHAQTHYTAYDQFGRAFRRALLHGEYKDHDNHVELPDGTRHEYAPATQVQSEMERLVEIAAEASDDHTVRLAAFAHHRLTQIHPFADGNGRTARLISTFLLLRGGYLPLIVTRDDRDEYLRALREADEYSLVALLDFTVQRLSDTLRVVEQRALEVVSTGDLQGLSSALAARVKRRRVAREREAARGRDLIAPVVPLVERLLTEMLDEVLAPFREDGFDVAHGPPRLYGAGEFVLERVERQGLRRMEAAEPQWVQKSFRVGDAAEHEFGVGIVPILGDTDPQVAFVLDDPWGSHPDDAQLLVLDPEQIRAREVRRWMHRWFARILVDYTERL